MITGKFWTAAAERALKTAAQSLLVTLGAGAINILEVPWGAALAVAGGGAVASLLTSIVSSSAAGEGPALFGPETVEPAAPATSSDPTPLS